MWAGLLFSLGAQLFNIPISPLYALTTIAKSRKAQKFSLTKDNQNSCYWGVELGQKG